LLHDRITRPVGTTDTGVAPTKDRVRSVDDGERPRRARALRRHQRRARQRQPLLAGNDISGREVGLFVAVNRVDFAMFFGLTAAANGLLSSLAPR